MTEESKRELIAYLLKKIDAQFYGKVIIVMQSGDVVHIVEEKSMKLQTLNN